MAETERAKLFAIIEEGLFNYPDKDYIDRALDNLEAYATDQYQEGYKKGYVDAGIAAMTGQGDAA